MGAKTPSFSVLNILKDLICTYSQWLKPQSLNNKSVYKLIWPLFNVCDQYKHQAKGLIFKDVLTLLYIKYCDHDRDLLSWIKVSLWILQDFCFTVLAYEFKKWWFGIDEEAMRVESKSPVFCALVIRRDVCHIFWLSPTISLHKTELIFYVFYQVPCFSTKMPII